MDGGAWKAAVHGVARSRTQLSDFTFTFHFYALEKEMATHSSVLAWRIPGTGSLVGCCLWGHTESDTTANNYKYNMKNMQIVARHSKFLFHFLGGRIRNFWSTACFYFFIGVQCCVSQIQVLLFETY